MTRRFWIMVLGSGLFAGSLPACNPQHVRSSTPSPPPTPIGQDWQTDSNANSYTPTNRSPYQPIATNLPQLAGLPTPADIAPVRHDLPTAQQEEPVPGEREQTIDRAKPTQVSQSTPLVPSGPKSVVPETPVAKKDELPLLAAMRCVLEKHPEEAVACLKGYDKANQDLLLGLLAILACWSEKSVEKSDPRELAQLVDHLNGLLLPLPSWVPLVIDQMCFCRRIEKYGVYEPLPEEHEFRPGELVQIYVELRNFAMERRDRFYLPHLASSLEIHDYKGHIVWREDRPENLNRPDLSRSLRHDLFLNCRFCVPPIPQGSYTLWLQVADVSQKKHRTVKRSLDFRVTNMPVH